MARTFASLLLAGLWCGSLGCGGPTQQNAGPKASATVGGENDQAARIETNLAKLSDADRSAAVAQGRCPVSSEVLASMGVPIKLRVQDQDVWICCDGCKSELVANPHKFLKPFSPAGGDAPDR